MADPNSQNPNPITRRRFLKTTPIFALSLIAACANPTPNPAATPFIPTPVPVIPNTTVPIAPIQPPNNPSPMPSATQPSSDVSVEAKIGQMLMLGFRGTALAPTDPFVAELRDLNLGSVVLFQYDTILKIFDRNIQSPAQLAALDQSLQSYANSPLFISIDQEGGIINRLTEQDGFPATQSQQYYGTLNDLAATRAASEAEGKVLRAAGINLNLAPVVDVNTNPTNPIIGKYERSFSADPKVVTANAIASIEGYHAAGILTTLKHFPGHGSSTGDSHTGFVDVTTTWQPLELDPYRDIINAGLADAVMTAHIFNSNLDPQYPATLSKKIISGILREQLGFDGVVITDDMQMGAIREYYGYPEAVELALNAGVDILAIANNTIYEPDIAPRTISIVKQLVADGKITSERIDQSYQRIQKLKSRIQT